MKSRYEMGNPFVHRIIARPETLTELSRLESLHVYIDGDGNPWLDHRHISRDPSAAYGLVMDLLRRDPVASIYLGRPCHYTIRVDPACTPDDWTFGRYSDRTVISMLAALTHAAPSARHVTLIGYSGGGTLATLLASRMERADALLTIAANLDVDAWSEHHRYLPLSHSLDPAKLSPLPIRVRQLHLQGTNDANVPPATTARFFLTQPTAIRREYATYDHRCCWLEVIDQVLIEIGTAQSPPHH